VCIVVFIQKANVDRDKRRIPRRKAEWKKERKESTSYHPRASPDDR